MFPSLTECVLLAFRDSPAVLARVQEIMINYQLPALYDFPACTPNLPAALEDMYNYYHWEWSRYVAWSGLDGERFVTERLV